MFEQTYTTSPEQMPGLFMEAWNRYDAIALANLFSEDAEFVNVVGLWWHDRQAIWKAHDYGLRVIFPNSKLEIRKVSKKKLSPDVALVHARMKLIDQSGHGMIEKTGGRQNIMSFVMQKKEKGWVCASAHNTDIVPGKETNIIDEKGNFSSVDYRKTQ